MKHELNCNNTGKRPLRCMYKRKGIKYVYDAITDTSRIIGTDGVRE